MIFWKRRSSAPSFSMFLRYSSRVVAPMHWISPRANAGFSILAASIEPAAEPAPTNVWISSMNRMTSGFFCNSLIMERIRSSNWPRYLVPATTEAISSVTTRLLNKMRDTFFSTIRSANPSTMADLPTPGSPISTGLFFLRRLSIWATRSISFSRPTTGSNFPSSAALVKSVPKLSRIGVSLAVFFCWVVRVCWVLPLCDWVLCGRCNMLRSSSSSSSSSNPSPARGASGWRVSISKTLS